jgi:predicted SprT family Zn-dependent metalloprotease
MPKQEVPVDHLDNYLPPGTMPIVLEYLHNYKVHLTITRERKTVLGDYRHKTMGANHRISINGNLNAYSFLITLLHELAHLLTFEKFGNSVQAHGKEWKGIFGALLSRLLDAQLLPADIEAELKNSLINPAASSCADDQLIRVLRKYDSNTNGCFLLEELAEGELFKIKGERVFKKGALQRKRYQCVEVATKKWYLFSPVYEVKKLEN